MCNTLSGRPLDPTKAASIASHVCKVPCNVSRKSNWHASKARNLYTSGSFSPCLSPPTYERSPVGHLIVNAPFIQAIRIGIVTQQSCEPRAGNNGSQTSCHCSLNSPGEHSLHRSLYMLSAPLLFRLLGTVIALALQRAEFYRLQDDVRLTQALLYAGQAPHSHYCYPYATTPMDKLLSSRSQVNSSGLPLPCNKQ